MTPIYFLLTLALGACIGATVATLIIGRVIGIRCENLRHALMMLTSTHPTSASYQEVLLDAIKILEE